jgi:tetratricopeptide (TPR) repeat protein
MRSVLLHPETYFAWVQLAVIDVDAQNYQAAIAEAKQAVKLNPDAVTAHSTLGLAYLQIGQYSLAAAEERTVLRIDPTQPHAHADLALIALNLGNTRTARDEYLAEIRVQSLPYNRDAHVARALAVDWQGLGLVYMFMRDPARAATAYERAIGIDPTLFSAYDGLAFAQERMLRAADALASFGKAIQYNPQDETAFYFRGLLETALGQTKAAERDLRSAVALSPTDPSARAGLGDVLRLEGRYPEARMQLLQALQQARGTSAEEQVWVSIGRLYDATGQEMSAAGAYQSALKINAHDLVARLAYGEDLLKLHQPAAARVQFALVAQQDVASSAAYADLALAEEQLGHTSIALADLHHQIAINRGNRAALAGDFHALGTIYAGHRQWHDAAGAFAQAVAFGARTAEDYYDLGNAQARAGERTNAVRSLRRAEVLARAAGDSTLSGEICTELEQIGAGC